MPIGKWFLGKVGWNTDDSDDTDFHGSETFDRISISFSSSWNQIRVNPSNPRSLSEVEGCHPYSIVFLPPLKRSNIFAP
jgi:hypothetical protein